jgi:hypothetical protein
MTDTEVVEKVLASNKPSDIFPEDWKPEYLRFTKLIHPDACKLTDASEAMAKLNHYKDMIEKGSEFSDETGVFRVFEKRIEYHVTDLNRALLTKSVNNYKKLMALTDKSSVAFHRYLPEKMLLEKYKLTITLKDRAIPLTNQTLEQIHVNWLFSRMFEFTLWLRQVGYSHMGMNPTTVFVVPETHGIIMISFYHMTQLGKKAETISAKYKMWYPTTLFTKKVATPDIDLELCKKVAIYLLGDRSAAGTKLKMDKKNLVNKDILTFLLTKHENKFDEYQKYREILHKNFEKKFCPLDL